MKGKLYRSVVLLVLLALSVAVAGCDNVTPTPAPVGPTATAPIVGETGTATPAPPAAMTKVTIALGYIPDVQFAPFYLALNKGYYKDEGLDVTLRNGIVPDLIKELGQGENGVNFAVVSGDEVIPARLQGVPVKYVMTWYRQYPVAAVSISGKGPTLTTPADLKGRKIGVPGPYGSTYVGLLALLSAGGLTQADIQMESIGFTQVASLTAGQVDAAMVYAANEPTQLGSQGVTVSTLKVADFVQLASNGLATNDKTLTDNPELVGKVVRATLRAIQDTIADPQAAFDSSLTQVPEAGGDNAKLQLQILQETVKLMQDKPAVTASDSAAAPDANAATGSKPGATVPYAGWIDKDVWSSTQDLLFDAKLITAKGDVTEMFTNQFVQRTP
ncbi:MAG: ABC transporter substrate-binding protein [Chloroflexia bacterium]